MRKLKKVTVDELEALTGISTYEINSLTNFENAKHRLTILLRNYYENERKIREGDALHRRIGDMVVTYGIDIDGEHSVMISNGLAGTWNMSIDEVEEAAKASMRRHYPVQVISMNEVLGASYRNVMYVVTNTVKRYGASAVLFEETDTLIREKIGGDYMLIPSSIHEWLAVPEGMLTVSDLKTMHSAIMNSITAEEDRLSEQIFKLQEGGLRACCEI